MGVAPEIVLLNYVIEVLGYTLFEVMLVEAMISIAPILAAYVEEKMNKQERMFNIGVGYLFITIWAGIMYLKPPFPIVLLAYFISRFWDTVAFTYYRTWLYSMVPSEKASIIFAALSSYRKIILLFTPFVVGFLTYIMPTFPYLLSFMIFASSTFFFLVKG